MFRIHSKPHPLGMIKEEGNEEESQQVNLESIVRVNQKNEKNRIEIRWKIGVIMEMEGIRTICAAFRD